MNMNMELKQESLLELSSCKQTPSSFTALVTSVGGHVLVIANGSPYLHYLSEQGKFLASVRYPADVNVVCPLRAGNPPSVTCSLCCLCNGHIVATPVNKVLSKAVEDNDIFKDLCRSSSSAVTQQSCVPGDHISVTIATDKSPTISLLQAHVFKSTLIVSRRSEVSGDYSLSVYQQSRSVPCGECEVPLFAGPPVVVLSLTVGVSRLLLRDKLVYRPVIYSVCSDDSYSSGCDAILHPDLFSKLFGPEIKLSGSPVVLIGCQNGNILFTSLSNLEAVKTEGVVHCEPCLLPLVYCLGQPVQAIHALCLPGDRLNSSSERSSSQRAANALILIGRLGKLAVCSSGVSSHRTPSFVNFYVSGNIISSLLVGSHTLFYSTLSGVHRLDLKRSFIQKQDDLNITSPALNVQVSSKVASFSEAVVLLDTASVSEDVLSCLTLQGTLTRNKIYTRTVVENVNGDEEKLAKRLKECLSSLETVSSRLAELCREREKQNNALAELNKTLSTLSDVAQDCNSRCIQTQPFQVRFFPRYENIGLRFHKPCVDITLTYSGDIPLTSVWSLLIQVISGVTKNGANCLSSQVVSLSGLQSGELTTRVNLKDFNSLSHTFHCYLHHDASSLVDFNDTNLPTSVTLPLGRHFFDLLDFLLPLGREPRRLLPWQAFCPVLSGRGEDLEHVQDITIAMETVRKTIEAHNEAQTTKEDICKVFLTVLLVRQELVDLISEPEPESNEVILACYNGNQVCLVAAAEDEKLMLSVYASTESVLLETIECVNRRLVSMKQ